MRQVHSFIHICMNQYPSEQLFYDEIKLFDNPLRICEVMGKLFIQWNIGRHSFYQQTCNLRPCTVDMEYCELSKNVN